MTEKQLGRQGRALQSYAHRWDHAVNTENDEELQTLRRLLKSFAETPGEPEFNKTLGWAAEDVECCLKYCAGNKPRAKRITKKLEKIAALLQDPDLLTFSRGQDSTTDYENIYA